MKIYVNFYATLVLSQIILPLELVRVMGAGVVLRMCVEEVRV